MKERVIVLKQADLETLGSLRADDHLLAVERDGEVWVRGLPIQSKPDIRVSALPLLADYVLDESGYLFPKGGLTPTRRLPDFRWFPLAETLEVRMPTSALPGKTKQQVPISLTPSDRNETGEALLTDLEVWKTYAETAPQIRLEQVRFAVSAHGYALIIGTPLPPVPGKEYWMQHDILLPCGYDFAVPVVAPLIAHKMNAEAADYLMFDRQGKYERIPKSAFVAGSRSAVRLSGREEQDG